MSEEQSLQQLHPDQIRSFIKQIHDQLVNNCDVRRVSTRLHQLGAITTGELDRVGSKVPELGTANRALYEILVGDPDVEKLNHLSTALKEDTSSGSHKELAKIIDKFLANATPPKPVPPPTTTETQPTSPPFDISQIDAWKPVIKAFEDRRELLKYPGAFKLKEKYTSIHGKLGYYLSDLSDKQLKRLRCAVHTGIKGHFSKQIPVDIPLSEYDILDYICSWSSPLDVRLIDEAAIAIGETEALKESISDHNFDVVNFATEALGKFQRERAELPADDNHAHLGLKVNQEPGQYMLAELFRLQFYLIEILGIDRLLFEGFAEGCTMVMFRLMKEAAVMIAPILLSHVCQLREFGIEKIIVFGYFAIDVQLGTLHVPSKTPTQSREKHKAEMKNMEEKHPMTIVELEALKTKLRAKEEELSQSQNELKRTREELLKCRGEAKQLKELVDIDLVGKVESLKKQLEEKSSREKEKEEHTMSEQDIVSLIKDKFTKYQLQIEYKVDILSQVEEKMKRLSESKDLEDLKKMVNLKKRLKSVEGSIEKLKDTFTGDGVIEAVTGNSEIVSNKFHQGLLKLKELWDYAAKKEISLSRKKNVANLLPAVASGDLEVLKLLLATLKLEENEDGFLALLLACQHGHLQVVQYLTEERKANVYHQDKDGFTALLVACQHGQLQVVQYLTEEHKVNVYHQTKEGGNALHWSAISGNVDLLKFLLPKFIEAGKLHDVDVYGDSIIHFASRNGKDDPAMVSYIVKELKFSREERDKDGLTPLMIAAMYGKQGIISFLIDTLRVKLEEETNLGNTALLVACQHGQLQVVQYLTEERKVNVYHKNKNGTNALSYACQKGHLLVVKYLLPVFGNKKFDVDKSGQDCLTVARMQGHREIVKYLISEGGFASRRNI